MEEHWCVLTASLPHLDYTVFFFVIKLTRMFGSRLISRCLSAWEYFMESAGVWYLRTSCWHIRNRTSERSERLKFLIQKQRVRKYRTKHFSCGIVFIIYILRYSSFFTFWRPFYFKSFKNVKICRYNKKLTSRSVYPFPLLFPRLSTVYFIDSETNETIALQFRNVFHFFGEKNSWSKTFHVECVRSGAASCNKRREFWRETRTPLWLLIGRIIFLTREKTSFAILIGRIIFFHMWKPSFAPLIG